MAFFHLQLKESWWINHLIKMLQITNTWTTKYHFFAKNEIA